MPLNAALGLVLTTAGPGPSLEWSAPPGCPGQAQVLEQARALIGGPAIDAALQHVTIRGTVEVEPVGFSLDIDIRTPSGVTRKTARADDCNVLAGVAALMVAVAVDPLQVTRTLGMQDARASSPPPHEVPEPDPEPTLPEVQPPRLPGERASPAADAREGRAPPPRARARALGGFARVSGSIGRGIVPSLDGGLALGAGLLAPRLRAELVAFHIFAQDAHYPAPSPAGATVAAWGGSLRLGPRWQLGPLELHGLASAAGAALTARGFGLRNPRSSADAWIALGLVPGLRWSPSPRVAVGADLEAEVALYRPGFTVGGLPPVYRAAQLGVRGSVVVELRWGGPTD
jgi:hypothetical protein